MPLLDLSSIQALILDMDGVLWRSQEPIGDLPAIFAQIARRGWKVVLATNNATRSISMYVERMASFGVQVAPWQVVNSAQAAARFLQRRFPQGGAVFAVGERGVQEALEEHGFHLAETNVLAVVSSMDRSLSYEKLRRATLLIRGGALFVATNPDRTFPTPEGLIPGAGSILSLLEAASDQQPIVCGKPAPEMYLIALERLAVSPAHTLVVGDRPETDIAGAQAIGCRTALVLSGVVGPQEASCWQPPPDLIIEDLTTLVHLP
ncbi:MAG: HAD-IIA family hydrolase [Anaerolineales bacterium]|nr:HAD-IIA family hydrolase [Anaerolineales bacterium]